MDISLLTGLARASHGLVHRRDAIALGWTDDALSYATKVGQLERLHPSVYRIGGTPSSFHQSALAACLAGGPGAVASHRLAAALWGVLPGDQPLEVSVPDHRLPRVAHTIVHRSSDLAEEHCTVWFGVPVTKPARLLVDLGAVVTRHVVADVLDRCLVAGLITPGGAESILDQHGRRGRGGVGALRWALDERALGADRPESVLEARMARLMRRFGLPSPEFQYEVRDAQKRFIGRVDFAWPQHRVVVEVDGFAVHGSASALGHDLSRQNALVRAGWVVLRFTWHQVVRHPNAVIAELRAVLCTSVRP